MICAKFYYYPFVTFWIKIEWQSSFGGQNGEWSDPWYSPCESDMEQWLLNLHTGKFDVIKAYVISFKSHSYLTCVTTARLQQHLSNIDVILISKNICDVFWVSNLNLTHDTAADLRQHLSNTNVTFIEHSIGTPALAGATVPLLRYAPLTWQSGTLVQVSLWTIFVN